MSVTSWRLTVSLTPQAQAQDTVTVILFLTVIFSASDHPETGSRNCTRNKIFFVMWLGYAQTITFQFSPRAHALSALEYCRLGGTPLNRLSTSGVNLTTWMPHYPCESAITSAITSYYFLVLLLWLACVCVCACGAIRIILTCLPDSSSEARAASVDAVVCEVCHWCGSVWMHCGWIHGCLS